MQICVQKDWKDVFLWRNTCERGRPCAGPAPHVGVGEPQSGRARVAHNSSSFGIAYVASVGGATEPGERSDSTAVTFVRNVGGTAQRQGRADLEPPSSGGADVVEPANAASRAQLLRCKKPFTFFTLVTCTTGQQWTAGAWHVACLEQDIQTVRHARGTAWVLYGTFAQAAWV